jgi:hypothetical protein
MQFRKFQWTVNQGSTGRSCFSPNTHFQISSLQQTTAQSPGQSVQAQNVNIFVVNGMFVAIRYSGEEKVVITKAEK